MTTFPTEWKVIKFHGSSHHQAAIVYDSFGDFGDFLYGVHQQWGDFHGEKGLEIHWSNMAGKSQRM